MTGRIFTEEAQGPRSALRPLANGKLVELFKLIGALFLSAMVAYFTAEAETKVSIAVVTERENNHFQELKNSIADLKEEIRAMRRER